MVPPLYSSSQLESAQAQPQQHHVLYPRNGRFNALRKRQTYLKRLLEESVDGYSQASCKKKFVELEFLPKLPGGLKICSPSGIVTAANKEEAIDRISQRLRDLRKPKPPKKRPVTMAFPPSNDPPVEKRIAVIQPSLNNKHDYVIHPPSKNAQLSQLLQTCADEYFEATDKRAFVQEKILALLDGGTLEVCRGDEFVYEPNEEEAFCIVSQKIWSVPRRKPTPPPTIATTTTTALFDAEVAAVWVTPETTKPTISTANLSHQQQLQPPFLPPAIKHKERDLTHDSVKDKVIEALRSELERLRRQAVHRTHPEEQSNETQQPPPQISNVDGGGGNGGTTLALAVTSTEQQLRMALRERTVELERERVTSQAELNRLRALVRSQNDELRAARVELERERVTSQAELNRLRARVRSQNDELRAERRLHAAKVEALVKLEELFEQQQQQLAFPLEPLVDAHDEIGF